MGAGAGAGGGEGDPAGGSSPASASASEIDEARADDDDPGMSAWPLGRASRAMELGAPGGDDDGPLAQVLMARLFPTQIARPRIGRFDLLEFLGEGGMGSVYAAYDARLDRRVAIKFLRPQLGEHAHAEARLLREAQALARLSHPNIVAVHEVWEEDGRIHVAMEYVDGEDLATWQRGDRSWREIVEVYRQAGEGLAAAHAADLIHRDFKPHNAIRRRDGVVKVLDFGLARVGAAGAPTPRSRPITRPPAPTTAAVDVEARTLSGDDSGDPGPASAVNAATPSLTRTGAIMGTPLYMAPEQHEGAPADARSDQYSLCVALWEGLYGQLPFAIGTMEEVRAAILAGARVEPRDLRGVPPWIRQVLERGLARDPAARYPSMPALLRELGRDPAIRRRRALAVGAGIVAMIVGGLAIAELRSVDAPAACVVGEDAALWGAARRSATQAGILGAGDPVAAATWERLEPRLAAYAEALAATRQEACETHRRGLHSDALYDLRIACLDRRRAGFVRLTDLFAAGDRKAALQASRAVAELPPVARCSDTEALALERPPPTDPAIATRVAELRQELARAHSEESAGKYAEAEARAAAVAEAAGSIAYPPLRAEALLRWGSASMQRGARESADRLDLSLWTALRAEHRSVAAEAAAKRIFARVELDDRSADVSEALALAASLVDREGAADWRTRWLLANNEAIARERRGDLSGALAGYKGALARIPAEGDAIFERAVTLQNMAPLQVSLGERDAGEAAARRAVEEFRGLYGPEHPSTASAEAVSAIILAKIGRRRESAAVLAAAIDRAAASAEDGPPLWMFHQAASLALARGDVAAAIAWCDRAEPQIRQADGSRSPWELPFAAVRARVAALAGDPRAASLLDEVDADVLANNQSYVALERAEIAWLLGQVDEVASIARALVLEGQSAESEHDDARLLLARALVARGDFVEAESILRGAGATAGRVEVRPEPEPQALALGTLAAALAGQDRRDEAAAVAREAAAALADLDEPGPALAGVRETVRAILGGN